MSPPKMIVLAISLMALSACSTAPLKVVCPVPIVPAVLLTPPPLLEPLPPKPSLSGIAAVVSYNYGRYHELATQVEALQEWARSVVPPPLP